MSNDLLVEISRSMPQTQEELKDVPGMSDSLYRRHAEGLYNALKAGQIAPLLKKARTKRPDQAMLNRYNALHEWRKEQGRKLKVESDVILPRDYLEKIAAKNPANLSELKEIMREIPWRFEQYGKAIIAAIQPKGSL
jgi:ribonuclease D